MQFSALLLCWEMFESELCCDVPNVRLVYEAFGSIYHHSLVWGRYWKAPKILQKNQTRCTVLLRLDTRVWCINVGSH